MNFCKKLILLHNSLYIYIMSLNSFYDMTDLKTPNCRCSFLGVRKTDQEAWYDAAHADQCRGRKPESNHVRGVGRAAPRRRTADEDAAGCRCRPSLEANESSGLGVRRLSLVTADAECRCGSGTNAQMVSQLLLLQSNSRRAQADGGIEAFLFAAAVVSRQKS